MKGFVTATFYTEPKRPSSAVPSTSPSARWNAAIFLRAVADIVRFTGAEPDFSAACESFPAFCHLALWACAILRRDAADIIRVGW